MQVVDRESEALDLPPSGQPLVGLTVAILFIALAAIISLLLLFR